MITLTSIYHDGFILRQPGVWTVVFDYWKNTPGSETTEKTPLFITQLPQEELLIVLVSHHHKDHLNTDIFEWRKTHPKTHYILSKDTARHCRHRLNPESIWSGEKIPPQEFTILTPGNRTQVGPFTIHAFRSTDIGNSYVLDGPLSVMHAGDLNAWIWLDESTPGEVKDMLNRYTSIINSIKQTFPHLDIAMFPVDSRIGRQYWTGAKILIEAIDITTFIPMHFGLGTTPAECRRYTNDALDFPAYAPVDRQTRYVGLLPGAVWARP